MIYKYCSDENYEDFAAGRVIMHRPGMTNYPVRLAGEIFQRCLEYMGKSRDISIYDPCCGSGYLLTVLGLMYPHSIGRIYCSDVSTEAVSHTVNNLSLLSVQGLLARRDKILEMIELYDKPSHREALLSTDRFLERIKARPGQPEIECFTADALSPEQRRVTGFKADVVITDVPYGCLVSWSGREEGAVSLLLEYLLPFLHGGSVVAVSSDKGQKLRHSSYERLEKIKAGKRQIELLRMLS